MKFNIKISKFLKLYKKAVGYELDSDSMYWLIDTYLRTHHQSEISLSSHTLDYAFFKLAKKIDRTKLAVDIFVPEPKFTMECPTNLVKLEYRGFFLNADGGLKSKKFLQLLKFAGVKEFFIKCDEDGCVDAEWSET